MNTSGLRRCCVVATIAKLATALVVAVLLAGCTTSGSRSGGSNGYITGTGVVVTIPVDDRTVAPDLVGPALGGGDVSLVDQRGSYVVLNIWAAWCSPCRAEADDLVEAAKQMPRVKFLGINFRDEDAQAEAFVREKGIPYPSLVDPDGSAMLALHLSLTSLPSTLVVDPQGRIAAVVKGTVTASTLVGLIQDLKSGA